MTMPIPTFEEMMLPLLQALADRKEKTAQELEAIVVNHFRLTEEDKKISLPSNPNLSKYKHRMHWAIQYLKRAQLLEAPRRGTYRITERGIEFLSRNPHTLRKDDLMEFEEFKEWILDMTKGGDSGLEIDKKEGEFGPSQTPEEMIILGYNQIKANLASDLQKAILKNSPAFFEHIIKKLLEGMGYGDVEVIGKSGDGGIDGFVKQDKLGVDKIYFQAKRFAENTPVTASMLRDFIGSLQLAGSDKGILVTTSSFPNKAQETIRQSHKNIVLIDGKMLANLMIEYDIGVTTETVYKLKRIDRDFFIEE